MDRAQGAPRPQNFGFRPVDVIGPDTLATERLPLVPIDRVVFMEAGQIVEVGTPEHFFTAPHEERTRRFLSQIL